LHQEATFLLPRNRAIVSAGAPNTPLDELASLHDVVEMEIRLTAGGAGEHL
jgi:hypothetical protein